MKFCSIAVALLSVCFAATMSSCTQEYRCQCNIKYEGKPGLPDSSTREYNITDTKKNAQKLCAEKSNTKDKDGVTATETCVLF
jgi:hypothetical protein